MIYNSIYSNMILNNKIDNINTDLHKNKFSTTVIIRETEYECQSDGIFTVYCLGQVVDSYVYGYINGYQLLGASATHSSGVMLTGNPTCSINVKKGHVIKAVSGNWSNANAFFIPLE